MPNRLVCAAIVAAFLVLGSYYGLTNPPFEAPDEVWHYAYVRDIAQNHGFPILTAGVIQPWGQEGAQAPLYYMLGAPLIGWMDTSRLEMPAPNPFARIGEPQASTSDNRNAFLHDSGEADPFQGTTLALHLLRLYSVLLGGLTVAFTFALAREVFPDLPIVALASAAFVAFLPQFLFISSSVNNDNLTTLLSTLMLWQLARMLRRGISPARSAMAGVIAGAALLTKFNTVTLVPLALLVILVLAAKKRAWRVAIVNMGIVIVLAVAIAGWWYARNMLLYGDLSGLSLIIQMIGGRSAPIDPLRWFLGENNGLRLSTWGVFGWMNVLAAPPFYTLFDVLTVIGVLGMIVALVRKRSWSWGPAMLALWCVIVFAGVVYYNLQLPASQGRLLFPALGAWAVMSGRGIAALIPRRARNFALTTLAAGQVVVAAVTPALFIAPAYVPVQVTAVPPGVRAVNARFANGVQILGAYVNRRTIRPDDALDVQVYTSVASLEMAQAALFVHVVGSDGVIVAQRDSAIASGNWSRLTYPAIVADSLRLEIPVTARVPDRWSIEIGIYDLRTRVRWTEVVTTRDSFTIANLRARPAAASWGFDFAGRTELQGAEIDPRSGKPDSDLHVRLKWAAAPAGYRVFVHALGESDRIWASADEPLATDMHLVLHFAPDTPAGVYALELGVYPAGGDRLAVYDDEGQLQGDRLFLEPVRIAP